MDTVHEFFSQPSFIATAAVVGAAVVPPSEGHPGAPPHLEGQTVLMFQFEFPEIGANARIILAFNADVMGRLRTALNAAFDDVLAADSGRPIVHCPGCNQRLYGAVAERGGCLGCYPTLPEGEVDANGFEASA